MLHEAVAIVAAASRELSWVDSFRATSSVPDWRATGGGPGSRGASAVSRVDVKLRHCSGTGGMLGAASDERNDHDSSGHLRAFSPGHIRSRLATSLRLLPAREA